MALVNTMGNRSHRSWWLRSSSVPVTLHCHLLFCVGLSRGSLCLMSGCLSLSSASARDLARGTWRECGLLGLRGLPAVSAFTPVLRHLHTHVHFRAHESGSAESLLELRLERRCTYRSIRENGVFFMWRFPARNVVVVHPQMRMTLKESRGC